MTESFGVFKAGTLIYMSEVEENAMTKFRILSGDNFARIQDLKHLQSLLNNFNQEQIRLNAQASELDAIDNEFLGELDEDDGSPTDLFEGVSTALDSAVAKLRDLGFTEENLDATTERIKKGGKRIAAEVKNMGIRGAEALSKQLKELTTVVDEALSEAQRSQEEKPNVSDEPHTPYVADDNPLPYSKNNKNGGQEKP